MHGLCSNGHSPCGIRADTARVCVLLFPVSNSNLGPGTAASVTWAPGLTGDLQGSRQERGCLEEKHRMETVCPGVSAVPIPSQSLELHCGHPEARVLGGVSVKYQEREEPEPVSHARAATRWGHARAATRWGHTKAATRWGHTREATC